MNNETELEMKDTLYLVIEIQKRIYVYTLLHFFPGKSLDKDFLTGL